MANAKVALISNKPVVLEGLFQIFSAKSNYSIVRHSGTVADALAVVGSHSPDLIVVDLFESDDGFSAISAIVRAPKPPKVIVFTDAAKTEHAVHALDAGASAYLTSTSTAVELLEAVHTVLGGDTYISPCIAMKLIASLRTAAVAKASAQKLKLTVREGQIVRLLNQGMTNREIGQGLGLSEKTVKHYMTVLMQKLAARSRLEVVLALSSLDAGVESTQPRSIN